MYTMDVKKYIIDAIKEEYKVAPKKLYENFIDDNLKSRIKYDWESHQEMPENSGKLADARRKYHHYNKFGLDNEAERWHNEVVRLEHKFTNYSNKEN